MRRALLSLGLFLAALVAVRVVKAGGGGGLVSEPPDDSSQAWDPYTAADAYDAECPVGTVSPHCAALRGAVLYELVSSLEHLASHTEPGEAQVAVDALGVREPDVKEAALRLLAKDAKLAVGVPQVVAILVADPHWSLQRQAAKILVGTRDPALMRVGKQWQDNHEHDFGVVSDPKTPDLVWPAVALPAPAAVGFDAYPGATRYAPGESDRSLGFVTPDPVDKVVAFYTKKAGSAPLDYAGWVSWVKGHWEVYYSATSDGNAGVITVRTPPDGDVTQSSARVFVLGEKDQRAPRVISIYREDVVNGTVIQFVWDPKLVSAKAK